MARPSTCPANGSRPRTTRCGARTRSSTWMRWRSRPSRCRPKLIIAGGIGLFARLGLQALPRDRRQRRRLSDGRHGAFRRPRRRRRACLAGAACPCHHHHHAQIAARPARRPDPVQRRGAGQEVQLGDLPGPAGRPADACDRGQGGGVRRGAAAGLQDLREERGRERQGAGGSAARARASTSSPAAPTTI